MANGRRDWWNQGQPMPTEKLDTADIITRLAQFGSQMAQLAETGKKNKRHHFLTMADAMTKGFEAEFDNNKIQSSIAKLDKFYNDRADKYDLETQDAYKIYKDKMTAQLNENVEFDAKMKEWEGFSETSEQFINDMYQYSTLNNDSERLRFINRDIEYQQALKNKELSPLAMNQLSDTERYEAWQTDNMKNTISDYGAHVRNFGAKFYDRIPASIQASIGDTQFYMNDILRGWSQDGKIDDFEYKAWSGLVKNGDDQALMTLNSKRDKLVDQQINSTNTSLMENISSYRNNTNLIKIGQMDVGSNQVEVLFNGKETPAHFGVGTKGQITIMRDWWKTEDELNAIAKEYEKEGGVKSEQYLQAVEKNMVAAKFWEPVEQQQLILQEDIEKGKKILNSYGANPPAEYEGLFPENEFETKQQENIDDLKKIAYDYQNKVKDENVNQNIDGLFETINYVKSGYKNTNRLKWVKDITRKGDEKFVKKSGRNRWYAEKLKAINSLIKIHGDDWARAYNSDASLVKTYGALPLSVDDLYKNIETELTLDEGSDNIQNIDALLELRKNQL
jgi:archaellum component FlaF (FlaF/FlaG flagellin family)